MVVSGVQQSDSVTHIHIFILVQIPYPYRLLQNTDYSSLCYTVDPSWLSLLYVVVYMLIPSSQFIPPFPPHFPFGNHSLFLICVSLFLFFFIFYFFLNISAFFFLNFGFVYFIYLFIYLFIAVLGLSLCARAFSSRGKWGPLLIAVRGPLTIAASLVAEHRLQTRRLSNCGSRAQPLRGTWDLPRPGLEPASPAPAGRLSTTAPPGKPLLLFCK